jgi:tripartite-type tricarboxylate transporter receptor subunit TctC
LCAGLIFSAPNLARAWPDVPVRLVIPAPAGGTMDVVARLLSDEMSREIHQPVIVDNKPGAGGAIAVQALRSAAPDGHTLMITASNVLAETPLVMKVNFDPFNDLRPIAMVARTGLVLVGSPSLPAKDFKSLIAYAKANPGTMSFASYSTGTVSHYAGMMLNQKAGLDMQHVPFPGSPPALAQVMGNQIPIMFDGIPTSLPLIAGGKLKAYGVSSKSRSSFLPDVPTFAEQGYPELDFSNWVGVVAASNVPPDTLAKIRAAMEKVIASPKVKEQLATRGFEAGSHAAPDQLVQLMRADYDRNAIIVKTFGIQSN